MAEVDKVVDVLRRIGVAHGGRTPSQVALAWIIAKGAIPIPGAKNRHQAEDNAGALGWRMDDTELAELDGVAFYGMRTLNHRLFQHG
jgi:aryl-alcohol dehydrogenase-like predicted oxidoreductase